MRRIALHDVCQHVSLRAFGGGEHEALQLARVVEQLSIAAVQLGQQVLR